MFGSAVIRFAAGAELTPINDSASVLKLTLQQPQHIQISTHAYKQAADIDHTTHLRFSDSEFLSCSGGVWKESSDNAEKLLGLFGLFALLLPNQHKHTCNTHTHTIKLLSTAILTCNCGFRRCIT
jgi:hypothetical protein